MPSPRPGGERRNARPSPSTARSCESHDAARDAICCAPISPTTIPALVRQHYIQLVTVEEAFSNLESGLVICPIFQEDQKRIEARLFIASLAYCLHVTLTRRRHVLAPGLAARSALEKFAAVQMIDVHLPTTNSLRSAKTGQWTALPGRSRKQLTVGRNERVRDADFCISLLS
jgi:hypothetical protein